MKDATLTASERQWIENNRLQEECYHIRFAPRTSDGRLRERFLDSQNQKCSRTILKNQDRTQNVISHENKTLQVNTIEKKAAPTKTKDRTDSRTSAPKTRATPAITNTIMKRKAQNARSRIQARNTEALLQHIREMAKHEADPTNQHIEWGPQRRVTIRGISYFKYDLPHAYERPCTSNYCYKQEKRHQNEGITGFTRRCDKLCSM